MMAPPRISLLRQTTHSRSLALFCLICIASAVATDDEHACANVDSAGRDTDGTTTTCHPPQENDPAVAAAAAANANARLSAEPRRTGTKRIVDPLDDDVASFEKSRASMESMTEEMMLADAALGVVYVVRDDEDNGGEETAAAEEECRNYDDRCHEYQEAGRCLSEPDFMRDRCPLSCRICFEVGANPVRFGEEQMVDYYGNEEINDRIMAVIQKTRDYMLNQVYAEDEFEQVRSDCRNYDRKCSYYAATGWCEEVDGVDMRWMQEQCSPACQTCLAVEFWSRCGVGPDDIDAIKPGGLNALFEQLMRDHPDYNPTILSRPELANKDYAMDGELAETNFEDDDENPKPWVVTLDNFLTAEECDFLIAEGHRIGYKRSHRYSDELNKDGELDDGVEDSSRTSLSAWCGEDCSGHPMTRAIMERMVNLTGIPEVNSEWLQLLRYEKGQWYEEHHDAVPFWSSVRSGQRVITIFLYLNDVEGGGETHFTKLNLDVSPKRGMALMWPSVVDEDLNRWDEWTWHEARPVKNGIKYGANAWFHLRNFRKADSDGCT